MSQPGDKNIECPTSLRRKIRSFVKRAGRTSKRQTNALNTLFPKFGVNFSDKTLDMVSLFQREAPTVLEIGFGMGDSLAQMAIDNPDINYLGIEVHKPGIGSLLATIGENSIKNIRIINHDAVEVLQHCIRDESLDKVQIFFPDPWPKKRHHKRRLIQVPFVVLLAEKLKADGVLHIATDWKNYADWIEEVMSTSDKFVAQQAGDKQSRPLTKFENRGKKLGHDIWDLIYIRSANSL